MRAAGAAAGGGIRRAPRVAPPFPEVLPDAAAEDDAAPHVPEAAQADPLPLDVRAAELAMQFCGHGGLGTFSSLGCRILCFHCISVSCAATCAGRTDALRLQATYEWLADSRARTPLGSGCGCAGRSRHLCALF
jgi:hypothetical protein